MGPRDSLSAQAASTDQRWLTRRYPEGERLIYHLKGVNQGHAGTTVYEAQATGVVKRSSAGNFVEEHAWSNLVVNNTQVALSPAAANFRQLVSLDTFMGAPDLSQVVPVMGPITDLLTFCSHPLLAARQASLIRAGDHFYFKHGTPNSWAEGNQVLTGEDSIDLDITLTDCNLTGRTATVVVHPCRSGSAPNQGRGRLDACSGC